MKKIGILLGIICLSIKVFTFNINIFNKFENYYDYIITEKNDNSNSPNSDMYTTIARKESVDGWLVIYEVKGENPEKNAKEYFSERINTYSKFSLYEKQIIKENMIVFKDKINGNIKLYFVIDNFTGRYESNGDNDNLSKEMETVLYNAFDFK